MGEEDRPAARRAASARASELIDRRIDDAFAAVYEFLEPASARLHATLDADGCRALDQLERAYLGALAAAARGGRGCPPRRLGAARLPPRARVGVGPAGYSCAYLPRPAGGGRTAHRGGRCQPHRPPSELMDAPAPTRHRRACVAAPRHGSREWSTCRSTAVND